MQDHSQTVTNIKEVTDLRCKKMRYKLHLYLKKLPFQHAALDKTLHVQLQL